MNKIQLKTKIIHDEYTDAVSKFYDVAKEDYSLTEIDNNIALPENDNWSIGVIYGDSGCGKTTLLKSFGEIKQHHWDDKSIVSNFNGLSSEEVFSALSATGFNTVPAWLRPFSQLSNGEQFRANLARSIVGNENIILIDEFTSVINRDVAKSASFALQKYARKNNKKIILASCHYDIIEWLNPDWIYNPREGNTIYPRGSLCRPKIELKIFRCKYEAWKLFKQYHYLNDSIHKSSRCYLCTWNDIPVAFTSILSLPHARLKNAWRASRTVVLPDYQGLGIGPALVNYMGSLISARNGLLYRRIAHPSIINYCRRNNHIWQETSSPGANSKFFPHWKITRDRSTSGFKYIGPSASFEESKLFYENN
jgi:ABC-type lipoprotein export system ATPase subunit/GNAT superfamily N-acetyltransferase